MINDGDFSDVSIVIPQHGCWEQTVACCSSLWRHHGRKLSIVIVDDGSSRKDREISKRFLQTKVCWVEQSHCGITAAWNLGIRHCQTRYIVLLNNDVLTLKPWLMGLCGQLRNDSGGLVGTELRDERLLSRLKDSELRSDLRLLAGWCLCFERETYEKVGGFDESMRLYWSDTDWQLRWKKEFGKGANDFGLIPVGCMRHVGHVSARRLKNRSLRWREDRAVFLAKWSSMTDNR